MLLYILAGWLLLWAFMGGIFDSDETMLEPEPQKQEQVLKNP
jgi:nitrogen fixation-related uncharacterized protein